MAEDGFVIAFYLVLIALPFMFPLLSWALGRWYQGTLMSALIEDEKRHGGMLQNPNQTTTAPITTSMGASSSTLLHVSICVGPSIGQMFFMWVKGLVGGDSNRTMRCLITDDARFFCGSRSRPIH